MSKFREDVRARLLELMDEAAIPRTEFDATTLGELSLKLERRRISIFATCHACGARYTGGEWAYLDTTGYWNRVIVASSRPENEFIRTPAGERPAFEGRRCRCGVEMMVPVNHVKASVPWYQNGQ